MGKHFFDVGAYNGNTFDLFLSKHPEYDGHHVWCFEPYPPLAAQLLKRVQDGEFDKWVVSVCPFAIGDCCTTQTFYERVDSSGNSFCPELRNANGKVIKTQKRSYGLICPAVPLDSFVRNLDPLPLSITLKLDCEGMEYIILNHLLKASYATLNTIERIFVEWHNVRPDWVREARRIEREFAKHEIPITGWTL